MSSKKQIDSLSIHGFQSIKSLDKFKLNNLNVLIGANGAGKSNFINYFRMLNELLEQRLQLWVGKQGGADRILSYGIKETPQLSSIIEFDKATYQFVLEPTIEGQLIFSEEKALIYTEYGSSWVGLGSGHGESKLRVQAQIDMPDGEAKTVYNQLSTLSVFHFHDTSDTAKLKRLGELHDNQYLRSDASNLAAFLYHQRHTQPRIYEKIRQTVQLAIPFFDDFVLNPQALASGEEQIRLLWKQRNSDYALWPSQLSDGSIRFICLCTALLQANPPSTLIIDEPELGLHPSAINLLASLLRSASKQVQIIVSTQSVTLVDEFAVEDLIVVERDNGVSIFKRFEQKELEIWLEDYSVGELWEKNVLGGRPRR